MWSLSPEFPVPACDVSELWLAGPRGMYGVETEQVAGGKGRENSLGVRGLQTGGDGREWCDEGKEKGGGRKGMTVVAPRG